MTELRRPDFICIGMQKSGTRWLYEQLRGHPQFWMPPLKEIQFFGSRFPSPKHISGLRTKKIVDPRDRAFISRYESIAYDTNHPIEIYLSLFEFAGDLLTGDVTPHYSTFNEQQVDEVASVLPNVKIVLMVRDPIKRVWSALNDAANDGKLEREAVVDLAAMKIALEKENFESMSFPSRTFRNWSRHYTVKPFFLDHVDRDPVTARAGILEFLGADPSIPSSVPPSHNSKAGRPRAEFTPEIQATLENYFREEIEDCISVFGAPAATWRRNAG